MPGRTRFLRLTASTLILAGIGVVAVPARAGDFDLDEDDSAKPAKTDTAPSEDQAPTPAPIATIKPRTYSLAECLALAERNHPNLASARARLAMFHAQLEEAKWQPWSYWNASIRTGILPPAGGTPFYNAVPRQFVTEGLFDKPQPFFQFSITGQIPLYTFGKITAIQDSAAGQVRVGEWDVEKQRQQIRMDVRRAYYGLMLAHDALYIGDDVIKKLQKGLDGVNAKLEKGDTTVEEADKLRLEIYNDELLTRIGEAKKGEAFAHAALRFLTGVQTAFEIPDEPLKRPDVPLGPVVRYLTAARLFRGDLNMARAAVAARRSYVDFQRAQLFPNIGLGIGAGYYVAPSATPQNTAWISDPFNSQGFGAGALVGIDWGFDVLPKQARVSAAESQLEEARATERYALGGAAVEVENAYAAVVEAKAREETWDRAEHRARRWISSTQDAIDLGTKDERFLIEPLRVYVFARANHAQSLMDFNVSMSELARVTGWDAAAPTGG